MTQFLDIPFDDDYSMQKAAESIVGAERCFVVTPNVDHVVSYHESPDYRKAISFATHTLCDSRVIRILAKVFLGLTIRHVVPGSDLTRHLLSYHRSDMGRVLLVGGERGDDAQLAQGFKLDNVKQVIPPFGLLKDAGKRTAVVADIKKLAPDTILLAVGSPQQEMIAAEVWQAGLNARLLCIGASVDFLTGRQRRAPLLFQKLSIEWLYRLGSNPQRLVKRYLYRDLKIFPLIYSARKQKQ